MSRYSFGFEYVCSIFSDTTLWTYLPIQDAIARGKKNNLRRCLLVQLLHTYLSWQVDLVLAEQGGTAAVIAEEAYYYGTSGSLLYQSSQIAVTCT